MKKEDWFLGFGERGGRGVCKKTATEQVSSQEAKRLAESIVGLDCIGFSFEEKVSNQEGDPVKDHSEVAIRWFC